MKNTVVAWFRCVNGAPFSRAETLRRTVYRDLAREDALGMD